MSSTFLWYLQAIEHLSTKSKRICQFEVGVLQIHYCQGIKHSASCLKPIFKLSFQRVNKTIYDRYHNSHHKPKRSKYFWLRRFYLKFFSPARKERRRAILTDFEEDLMDVNPRLLHKKFKSKLLARTVALSFILMIIGGIGPNFFDFSGNHGVEQTIASTEFENRYAEAMLITLDEGFLEKTYSTTEGSKGVKGIFFHTVEPGETVSEIALDYDVPLAFILVNNDIYDPGRVRVGTKLKIANGIIHKVKSNDTVSSIAKKYEAEEENIVDANEDIDSGLLAGTEIVVPGAKKGLSIAANTSRSSGSASKFDIALSQANGKLLFPTVGKYTQYFHSGHPALDIASTGSPPIYSADSGQVSKAQCGWSGGYGCHIMIDHGNGMKTLYAHMRRLDVTVGEYVSRGQIIGQMGNTGRVYGRTGIHLHFEVVIGGIKRNPIAFF
jgi:murein DD-endopeptidase MepM/ murein hydrolase activator NlpD